jgi:hypothetical protein
MQGMEIVQLTLDAYEGVRQFPRRFFSARGHQEIAVETMRPS